MATIVFYQLADGTNGSTHLPYDEASAIAAARAQLDDDGESGYKINDVKWTVGPDAAWAPAQVERITSQRKAFTSEGTQVDAAATHAHWKLVDVTTDASDRYVVHTYAPDGKALRNPDAHRVTVTFRRGQVRDTVMRVRRTTESDFATEAIRSEFGEMTAFEFVAPAFYPLSS